MEKIKNHKNAYERALQCARIIKKSSNLTLTVDEILETIFPELAISEYEQTRRELICFIEESHDPRFVGNRELKERFLKWLDDLSEERETNC